MAKSNHRALIEALHGIVKSAEHRPVSIKQGLLKLNHFGFSFISFLLVLPFMQPFPIGPISVLGGVTFAAFGWQILKGYATPHLPQKIDDITLSVDNWRRITNAAIKLIQWTEKFTKPRLLILIQGPLGVRIEALCLIFAGILMAVPFGMKNGEKEKMASQFFKRTQEILQSEKIEFDKAVVAELVKKHFPDFRRVVNELQRYSKFGEINQGILAQITSTKISDIVKHIAAKDFGSIRKWAATEDIDPTTVFRMIYDNMYDILKPNSIPKAVCILADYQYKNAFVADPEINMVACLTELMVECEFS